ncbi:MAG: TonB-dependent receptor [Cytophagia bacterium]|nr:MAG: TonB-dependent receptor [Cytophagia bacterium]TAG44174.1 MAG: TonB-dependent receptor [Cytophagia bacterium]
MQQCCKNTIFANYSFKLFQNVKKSIYFFILFLSISIKIIAQNKEIIEKDTTKQLEEVIIKSQKENQKEYSTQSTEILKGDALNTEKGKTLGDLLRNINGVNTLQTGATIVKPIIQGNSGNRILILNNGIRQEGQQWGSEHAPEIDPFIANQVTVIKGAESVRYGAEAIGGVILVETPDLFQKRKTIEWQNIGFSNGRGGASSFTFGQSRKNWAHRIQGSLKKLGDANSATYTLSNTGVEERNFSVAIGSQFKKIKQEIFYSRFDTDLAILSAAHIGNMSDLANAIDRQTPFVVNDFTYTIKNPRQKVIHQLLKWQAESNLSFLTIKWQLGHQINQRQEFDVRRTAFSTTIPTLNLEITTTTFDLVLIPNLKKTNFSYQFGLNGLIQQNKNVGFTGIRPLLPQFYHIGVGFFGVMRYVSNQSEWEFGGRIDNKDIEVKKFNFQNELITNHFNFKNFSLTFGNIYQWNEKITSRFTIASAFRPPSVAEMFSEGVHHGSGVIEEGNQNLAVEKSWKTTFNFQYQSKKEKIKQWNFQSDIYYQYLDNYIFSSPKEIRATIRGVFPVLRYQQTQAIIFGADFTARYYWNRFLDTKIDISLIKGKDLNENAPLIFMPANKFKNEWTYLIEKKENKKLFFDKLSFSLAAVYVMQQQFAPPVFTANQALQALLVGDISLPNTTFDLASPPDAYLLFQADINLKIKKMNFGIRADNLFNQSYREYLNRFRYFADDTGRNISIRLGFDF